MEVLCAGEDLLRVERGQVSPSLLADLLCFSFSGGGWCFLFGCLFLVCFGCCCLFLFLSPSISRRGVLRFSHISCDSQVIALLVERGTRILTRGFTLSLTSYTSIGLPASLEIRRSLRVKKKKLIRQHILLLRTAVWLIRYCSFLFWLGSFGPADCGTLGQGLWRFWGPCLSACASHSFYSSTGAAYCYLPLWP